MSVTGIEFLVLILLLSTFFHALPSVSLRQAALALLSLVFLCSLIQGWIPWLCLLVFLLSGYGVALALRRRPRRWLFWSYLVLLVSAFMLLKRYEFLGILIPAGWLAHTISILGLSYMLFRQIHFIVDMMQGQIAHSSLLTYLYYQLNVFTLISGPIQRYAEFQGQWDSLDSVLERKHEVLGAYLRVLLGLLQVSLLGEFFYGLYETAVADFEQARLLRIAKVFYGFPLYVYFNFSGYCNVVIGCASLLGVRLPENFDHPYLARNMIEYWNRWHITLSHWLRDYLFTPLYMAIARRWPKRSSSFASPCFFVVFLFAGVWHGSTYNFVVFGLLNGVGVSAAKMWENWIVRHRGRSALRSYLASRRIRLVANLLNLNFACVTFLFFPPGLEQCVAVIRSLVTGQPVS